MAGDNLMMARQGTSFYDAAAGVSAVQTITLTAVTAGTYTLTYKGATTTAIAFDALAADVKGQLENMATTGAGNVTVTGNAAGPYTVTFTGDLADAPAATLVANSASLTGGTAVVAVVTDGRAGIDLAWGIDLALGNSSWNITLTGATGGTFTVTFDGQTTAAIPYNATPAAVATALKLLSKIGEHGVSVIGAAGSRYDITFRGALDGTDKAVTATGSLTPGTAALAVSGGELWVDSAVREIVYLPDADRSARVLDAIDNGVIESTTDAVTEKPAAPWGVNFVRLSRHFVKAPANNDTLTYDADLDLWVPGVGK